MAQRHWGKGKVQRQSRLTAESGTLALSCQAQPGIIAGCPFAQDSHSGSPKQRTLPVYCLGKKHSYSLGEKRVLPPPTYTRPRDRDGPAHTGPRTIFLSTAPVEASRATSLPLP